MGLEAFWSLLAAYPGDGIQLAGTYAEEPVAARYGEPAAPLPPALSGMLAVRGVRLYSHQAEVLELSRDGSDVVLCTPTASGKTLAFCLPVFEALIRDPEATALFLYPMKALAYDQLAAVRGFERDAGLELGVAVYDGDTPDSKRREIRERSRVVLSNPHAMHRYLRYHRLWERFFRGLRYLVLDEAHWYRGVFGAHVAYVLRRLLRVAERYGSHPQVLAASATMADPAEHVGKLCGREFRVVSRSGAPRGRRFYLFWDAPAWEGRSPYRQAADMLSMCVKAGMQAICLSGSRKMAELIAAWAGGEGAGIVPYRAGYLARERREIERGLKEGRIRGVSATNALELGVDIGGIDAVIMAGFPGTVASFRQQAGRAGRSGRDAVVVLVGLDDPLNRYWVRNFGKLFGVPVEQAVVALDNPHVVSRHVLCASDEVPVDGERDRRWFGPLLEPCLDLLSRKGEVRHGSSGWRCARAVPPSQEVALDAFGDGPVAVVCGSKKLEEVELRRALLELHPGAVYLHLGRAYRVAGRDLEAGKVYVEETPGEYHTSALREKLVEVAEAARVRALGPGRAAAGLGKLVVRERVTGYVVKKFESVISKEQLPGQPEVVFETVGMWLRLPPAWRDLCGPGDWAGGLHAVEHLLIGAAPVLAMCDRWDVGGFSAVDHPELGPVVFVYDGFPGGSGVSERLFAGLPDLAAAALEMVRSCRCRGGCPSCVMSPKCGSGNEPLDKGVARRVLEAVVRLAGAESDMGGGRGACWRSYS
jgi:DEAD/DEAH box helicase domain-containing protein